MSRRLVTALTSSVLASIGLIAGYLSTAGVASAMPVPDPASSGVLTDVAPPAPAITVVHHSSSLWAFVVVALVAATTTLTISLAVGSVRRSRRRLQAA